MKITTQDVLAPANFVSLVGFILTILGSLNLNTGIGLSAVAVGRFLDVMDGPIARRTHTSRFGAVLDATIDKLSILAIVIGLFVHSLAPVFVIGFILLQNAFVATINIVAATRKIVIVTELTGKRNIFFQISTMLLFSLSHLISGTSHSTTVIVAYLLFTVSLYYAAVATTRYLRKQATK